MKYLIALIGEAGAGKDTIMNKVVEAMPSLHKKIGYTTRPPRDYETDGIDYYFINNEKMAELVLEGNMLEACTFNDWVYGTGINSLVEDKVNIGVFNPEGIESIMLHKDEVSLYVFLISADSKTRWLRQLQREEEPDINEIYRRWKTDILDFSDLPFHYNELPNYTEEDIETNIEIICSAARMLEDKLR